MKKSAIIVSGGVGLRMNAGVPKQFLLLGGKPMLMHSMQVFYDVSPEISLILALPSTQFTTWRNLCEKHAFHIPHQVVAGGETRFHSVKNALALLDGDGLLAIHDGARPLVSESLIRSAFLTAGLLGNCIPVVPLSESLRMVDGENSRAVNRDEYRVVQTPQVFHTAVMLKAYAQDFQERFTDDAMVAESIGETIHLIDGDPVNLKVTHPCDLAAAEAILGSL